MSFLWFDVSWNLFITSSRELIQSGGQKNNGLFTRDAIESIFSLIILNDPSDIIKASGLYSSTIYCSLWIIFETTLLFTVIFLFTVSIIFCTLFYFSSGRSFVSHKILQRSSLSLINSLILITIIDFWSSISPNFSNNVACFF